MERKVVWNKKPSKFLAQALKWISEDSFLQAERVERELLDAVSNIALNPERYPPDKFKKDNPGHFRAFEKMSFRIAYKFTERQVRILRIRHVKQEPKEY